MCCTQRFERTALMLGQGGIDALRSSFVVVAGLGAVGGYAAEALARAGVGRLRLVDFDKICSTNINRQIYALQSTLGRQKTAVAAERISDINPDCRIDALDCFIHTDTLPQVLEGEPDIVIDAIDSLNPKVELLISLQERQIAGISSMGAALRDDASMIRYGLLKDVQYCPLASMLRKRLRRRQASLDVPCVYSIQKPLKQAAQPPEANQNIMRGNLRGRNRNLLGSLPTITAIFGFTIANQVIKIIISKRGIK
jgi:tRNA threonylcarbamoyladenosine dehydratase